ncbi:MAG TPA: chlorite dismutase family protein [Polyangiaceae bacterium]|jgi:chlorite dismutase|nr:chlorite dismutase family protein [Polyangiaceae bacterium]
MSDPHGGNGGNAPRTAAHPRAPSHGGDATIDVRERGAERDGQPQLMDNRLFMQLLVFRAPGAAGGPGGTSAELGRALAAAKVGAVIYEDVNDPFGFGLLTFSEDPTDFVTRVRPAVAALRGLELRSDFTMLGRTYSSGFEPDLRFWLLDRPRETVLNEAWPWAIWYPLRRSGAFARLEPREQGGILREHGTIGKSYAGADLAHDVRLACHGLDANDNEFVIGLIGKTLHPLSHVVQAMRSTRQTSEFIEQMGPFFVGRAVFRSAG